jgi:DNA polymerase-3 subunit delta
MPLASSAAVLKQIAKREPDPVYLIIGDDDLEMSRLATRMFDLVDDELRAFNTERLYAGERGIGPAAIVEAARMLPMMSDRRVVVVQRAEKMLKPRRRQKEAEPELEEAGEPPTDLDVLESYIRDPVRQTTLALVASDVDRTRRIYKAIQKHATIVECWGLKASAKDPRDVKGWELDRIAKEAADRAIRMVKESGRSLEPRAARLLAERAGTDIVTLRGDVERLLLYVGDKTSIDHQDVVEIASGETSQDRWAVTDAILRRDAPRALHQLGLALEGGGIPYMILGQLAYCVREKLSDADPRRVPAAVEALFRTDLELKNSISEPRVLLERLVVELCRG